MINSIYNPEKADIKAWRENQARMKQRLAQLEASAAGAAEVCCQCCELGSSRHE